MTTLQVRDVPEDVRRALKARAASAGQSLSAYTLSQLVEIARQPTPEQLSARIEDRGRVRLSLDPAALIRSDREHGS